MLLQTHVGQGSRQEHSTGCIREVYPFFLQEAAILADKWDLLQATFPGDLRIKKLNREISKEVHTNKTAQWREFLEDINLRKGAGKLRSTIKQLSGHSWAPDNQSVSFNSEPVWDAQRCAKLFNWQYTPHPKPPQRPTAAHFANSSHRTTEQPPPGSRQVSPTLLAKFGDSLLDHVGQ